MTRPKYDWRMREVPSDYKLPSSPHGCAEALPTLADISRPIDRHYTGLSEGVKRVRREYAAYPGRRSGGRQGGAGREAVG